MTLRFDVDAEANAAEIYIDDLSTHAGTVETSASPSQIECYALNGWFFLPNTGGEAVIDNVKITAIE
jgi:hypothetical protein